LAPPLGTAGSATAVIMSVQMLEMLSCQRQLVFTYTKRRRLEIAGCIVILCLVHAMTATGYIYMCAMSGLTLIGLVPYRSTVDAATVLLAY
jgi:hypothetical protein